MLAYFKAPVYTILTSSPSSGLSLHLFNKRLLCLLYVRVERAPVDRPLGAHVVGGEERQEDECLGGCPVLEVEGWAREVPGGQAALGQGRVE